MNSYDIGEIFDLNDDGTPYIWATSKQFEQFCDMNNLHQKTYSNNKKLIEGKSISIDELDSLKIKSNSISKSGEEKSNETKSNQTKSSDFSDSLKDVFLDDPHELCKNNIAGQPICTPETKNPHKLTIVQISALASFHTNGFEGPGVVNSVIDGDTVYITVYVPLAALAKGHQYSYYSRKGVRSFIHTNYLEAGFFANIKCRHLGIDAMEKATPEGQFAKFLTIDLFQRNKGKVWFQFPNGLEIESFEKYGRTLVKIYADQTKRVDYTDYLLKFNNIPYPNGGDSIIKSKYIIIAEKYDGGTKSDYSKNLTKRTEQEIETIKQILDAKLFEIVTANRQRENFQSSNEENISWWQYFLCGLC
jgi:endonuclease YncB( thermonuclease family)